MLLPVESWGDENVISIRSFNIFKFNEIFFFFFMKRLKILIVKVAEFSNPSTKNIDRQRYFIMCFEVF